MEIRRDENGNPKKSPFSLQLNLSKFNASMFEKASDEEKRQQDVMSESTTFFKDGMRKLFKNPLAVGSIIVLALILIIIIFAPLVVPYSYEEILSVNGVRDKGAKNLAPFTYSKMEQQYIALSLTMSSGLSIPSSLKYGSIFPPDDHYLVSVLCLQDVTIAGTIPI